MKVVNICAENFVKGQIYSDRKGVNFPFTKRSSFTKIIMDFYGDGKNTSNKHQEGICLHSYLIFPELHCVSPFLLYLTDYQTIAWGLLLIDRFSERSVSAWKQESKTAQEPLAVVATPVKI